MRVAFLALSFGITARAQNKKEGGADAMTDEEKKLQETANAIFYNKPKEPPRYGWRYGQTRPPDDVLETLFYNDNAKRQRIMPE